MNKLLFLTAPKPVRPTVPDIEPVSTEGPQGGDEDGDVLEVDMTSVASVTQSTARPSTPSSTNPDSGEFKVVCYFTNWAWYRLVHFSKYHLLLYHVWEILGKSWFQNEYTIKYRNY